MRLNAQQRRDTEQRIRDVIDQLLGGDIPAGGRCDITTLARQAGVDRTAFYGAKPYARLRQEFEQRLQALQHHGEHPDPRDAQISRLGTRIDALQQRIGRHEQANAELAAFKTAALSQLAAQHQEITRLRAALEQGAGIRRLPATPSAGT
ncbi:MAG: hypothetical protein ACRDND_03880 [Streptosporangiaceae bacterium]